MLTSEGRKPERADEATGEACAVLTSGGEAVACSLALSVSPLADHTGEEGAEAWVGVQGGEL